MSDLRQAPRFTAGGSPALVKIAEISVTAGFFMIAKGFIPRMGSKSFAIIEDARECEASGVPGARDYLGSARAEGFHDGRCPVRGLSWIVASMARQRVWPAFSHVKPFPLRKVYGHKSPVCRVRQAVLLMRYR